ncbi:hypothetical protein [Sulfurimonas sp.]|uniref:hypothetical protein n=1 Tax=Sulfurimonas sp. TaxID=2022749 RepID=UPI0025CD10C7|nr:hypothetical protein [Sulfurimonas sp.]MBW6487490.1 hypothetical protein [Sulfurimonas sp.]
MTYIIEKSYNKKHSDYKGIFENIRNELSLAHLVGKRTLMTNVNGVTTLLLEGAGFEIVENFKRNLVQKNGKKAVFVGLDDWSRPVFRIRNTKTGRLFPAVFLEENSEGKPMHSMTDWDEPDCPLEEEYQVGVLR